MKKTLLLVAGGFVGGMFVTAFFRYLPGNSGEWASWVQAVGSMLAIGAAFWVAHAQSLAAERRADTDEKRAYARVATLVESLARDCLVALHEIKVDIYSPSRGGYFAKYSGNRLVDLDDALTAVLSQPLSPTLIRTVVRLRREITQVIRALEAHRGSHSADQLPDLDFSARSERIIALADGVSVIATKARALVPASDVWEEVKAYPISE